MLFLLARSTYYYYLKHKDADKYIYIKQEILDIYAQNKYRYGYRRILIALKGRRHSINTELIRKQFNIKFCLNFGGSLHITP